MDLSILKKEVPCKWRVQSAKNGRAVCVAYIDTRQVYDLLDEAVGPENWQTQFQTIDGKLFCGIGIKISRKAEEQPDEWVWKFDIGTESNIEADKGEVSDAVKRAGVPWGIGRFLYGKPLMALKTVTKNRKEYPVNEKGDIFYLGEALTEYCNALSMGRKPSEPLPGKPESKKELTYADYFRLIQAAIKDSPDKQISFNIDVNSKGGKFRKLSLEEVRNLCLKYGGLK
jgi:hypothetical protein